MSIRRRPHSCVSITHSILAPPLDVASGPSQHCESLHASVPAVRSSPLSMSKRVIPATHITIYSTTMQTSAISSFDGSGDDSCLFEAKDLYQDSFRTLHSFYETETFCDVEIKVGNKEMKCHKVMLACVSQYFRTMFTSEMSESKSSSITIKDIDESALESLISFAYTAKIRLSVDNVQSLLYASSILQIESVARACCEFMITHLHPINCVDVRAFAELHGRSELMRMSDMYIMEHFVEVVESDEFVNMSVGHLDTVISSMDLNITSEVQVFEAMIKWIKHDIIQRKCHLAPLLTKVKLALLPAEYLVKDVCTDSLIRGDLRCRDIVDEAKHFHMSRSISGFLPMQNVLPRKSCAGVVFCVGGRGSQGDPFKSIECYNLRKNAWFQVTDMSTKRRHVGVVSMQNKVYAIGGHDGEKHLSSGEVFHPMLNKWLPIAAMSTQRRGLAVASLGGPLYAIGGLDDSTCYNTVERYDPDTDTWSSAQPMNVPRGGVAVVTLGKYIYAIGGNDGAVSLETCEHYDPHLNKWTMCAPMITRRAGAGVAELGGALYVIGGFDDNAPLDSAERFDPVSNEWNVVARMSCPRGGVGVAALAGKIYAVGGHDGTNYLKSVEAYNPETNAWESVAPIATCRAGAGIATVSCDIQHLANVRNAPVLAAAAEHL